MENDEVAALLSRHSIAVRESRKVIGSFDKEIFLVNGEYVLRPSSGDMRGEIERFARIEKLENVPKIRYRGEFQSREKTYQYIIVSLLAGTDLTDAVSEMTHERQEGLGASVAAFLDGLHAIPGAAYDIGHYVPLIPGFAGSWKRGHENYWEYLRDRCDGLRVGAKSKELIAAAFRYLLSRSGALDFQTGAALLHNDFHPKNLIVRDGNFSGVIDWECSQFGEPDFDLCHLIHWCIFPPKAGADFRPFLHALFRASPKCVNVPDIAGRLTIYQVEHELIQLIWSGGKSETDRIRKLGHWLDGSVEDALSGA